MDHRKALESKLKKYQALPGRIEEHLKGIIEKLAQECDNLKKDVQVSDAKMANLAKEHNQQQTQIVKKTQEIEMLREQLRTAQLHFQSNDLIAKSALDIAKKMANDLEKENEPIFAPAAPIAVAKSAVSFKTVASAKPAALAKPAEVSATPIVDSVSVSETTKQASAETMDANDIVTLTDDEDCDGIIIENAAIDKDFGGDNDDNSQTESSTFAMLTV